MNKLTFLLTLLKYSIINPLGGKELLASKYQTWQDSRRKNSIFKYESKKLDLDEAIRFLFPNMNCSINDFKQNIQHLENHTRNFFNRLQNEDYPSKKKPYPIDYNLDNMGGFFLYVLCKILKPSMIVETGVAYGLSTMYILQALYENKNGLLCSVDSIFRPWESEQMIGSAVPPYLHSNWNLVLGTSSKKLKKLLISIGPIDIFFHDSLHTSKNMTFEFETAWPYIKENGFLISDDISSNNAFYEFYSRLNLEAITLQQKGSENSFLGIVRKT